MTTQNKKQQDIHKEPADDEAPARMPIGRELASRPFRQFMDETRCEASETLAEWEVELGDDAGRT